MGGALALAMQLAERAVPLTAVLQSRAGQALASRTSARHLGWRDRLEEHLRLSESNKSDPHVGLAQKRVGLDDGSSEGATRMKMGLQYRGELEWWEEGSARSSMQRNDYYLD